MKKTQIVKETQTVTTLVVTKHKILQPQIVTSIFGRKKATGQLYKLLWCTQGSLLSYCDVFNQRRVVTEPILIFAFFKEKFNLCHSGFLHKDQTRRTSWSMSCSAEGNNMEIQEVSAISRHDWAKISNA